MEKHTEIRPDVGRSPVHPLALMAVLGLDWLWGVVEIGGSFTGAGLVAILPMCLAIGALAALCVGTIQIWVAGETWGAALAKAFVLGLLAALPFQIATTAIGAPLLLWSGIRHLRQARA